MKPARLLTLMIAAALPAAPLYAEDQPADIRPPAAAFAAPAATAQDDDEEPDPAIRPDDWRGDEFRWIGNSLGATLPTLDGATLQLPRDVLGKLTLLHFWSTQGIDIPQMRALYDKYHERGLQIIGINIDRDCGEVESFIRQQGLAWPQVFTGKGDEDPLLTRLTHTAGRAQRRRGPKADEPASDASAPQAPYWLIERDGRIVLIERRDSPSRKMMQQLDRGISSRIESDSELAERFSFYWSGEFLAVTPLLRPAGADSPSRMPPPTLAAIQAKLSLPGWTAPSKAEKVRSFREALAAGRSLEQNHPDDPNLAVVRNWMLIAARWLALTTDDKALDSEATAIANRLLASRAAPAASLLADYVVMSARLNERRPRTKAGSRLIQDFAARYADSNAASAAQVFAITLAWQDAQNGLREQLVEQLDTASSDRADPMIAGFLRDCCNARSRPVPFSVQLTRMDGSGLALPADLLGKVVIIQFWSAAHPPRPVLVEANDRRSMPYTGLATVPSEGVVVVGINLDRNRDEAETFLKKSRYPDWIHTFSGLGWDDPAARACDVLALPRTIVLNRYGEMAVASHEAGEREFISRVAQLVAQPAVRPAGR